MFGKRTQLGFPRKVVGYYLLFCMVAVCWLTVGILTVSHSVLNSRATNACLSRLGKTAAAVEIEYLRYGAEHLSDILLETKAEAGLAYAAVVAPDGKILAHTDPQLTGTQATEPTGSLLRWGNVTGVRFVDPAGHLLREYRVPLVADSTPFGLLRMTTTEPSVWGTVTTIAHVAPVAVLVPLAFIAAGALVLSRLTGNMATIEQQLRKVAQSPVGSEPSLTTLPAKDAATLGWNRMVEYLQKSLQNAKGESLEHRLSQAVAAHKQNELDDILQNLSEGIAVTDMEGRITFANRAIAGLLGDELADNPLDGQSLEERLLQEMPSLRETALLDPQAGNHPAVSELQRQGEKATRILRVSRQPLRGERVQGQVWSLRDVTQQKLAEKMRDQFIDTATHELRTPLSNIKAYAETLATCETIDIEDQKEFCNIINSETTRLARFVDDLLSISSMEVGSLSINCQEVDLKRLFEEAESKVVPLMTQKNIAFESRLPEKLPKLKLDKEKMAAVLVNLLGNAAKYTPNDGHVSMKVEVDGPQLSVAIEDTGIGIDPDELPNVFEKFFRSTDERVQKETGTGLGLSLAQEVVRMHGGDLTVKSQLNRGSTFTITIPMA